MRANIGQVLLGFSLLATAGCCSTGPAASSPGSTTPKPQWHSVVMAPRTNLPPIHFYNKINPVWWFGNVDEPRAPAWYRPNGHARNFMWYLRNPFENFSNYVIGVADKKTTRYGVYPTEVGNPNGGWNFAVTRRRIVYLPFIDYKHHRFEFYFGWRERGNFGAKLNFRQKLPPPKPPPPAAGTSTNGAVFFRKPSPDPAMFPTGPKQPSRNDAVGNHEWTQMDTNPEDKQPGIHD